MVFELLIITKGLLKIKDNHSVKQLGSKKDIDVNRISFILNIALNRKILSLKLRVDFNQIKIIIL